jgi:hypothetical protein
MKHYILIFAFSFSTLSVLGADSNCVLKLGALNTSKVKATVLGTEKQSNKINACYLISSGVYLQCKIEIDTILSRAVFVESFVCRAFRSKKIIFTYRNTTSHFNSKLLESVYGLKKGDSVVFYNFKTTSDTLYNFKILPIEFSITSNTLEKPKKNQKVDIVIINQDSKQSIEQRKYKDYINDALGAWELRNSIDSLVFYARKFDNINYAIDCHIKDKALKKRSLKYKKYNHYFVTSLNTSSRSTSSF